MRFKWIGNKEKANRRISWFLVVAIIFSLITFRAINVKADTKNEIRILEIQPADSFKINTTYADDKTGEFIANDSYKYKVVVEHITMSEFIGKVDKINGKYDVIVIGRYIDNNMPNTSYQFNGL